MIRTAEVANLRRLIKRHVKAEIAIAHLGSCEYNIWEQKLVEAKTAKDLLKKKLIQIDTIIYEDTL